MALTWTNNTWISIISAIQQSYEYSKHNYNNSLLQNIEQVIQRLSLFSTSHQYTLNANKLQLDEDKQISSILNFMFSKTSIDFLRLPYMSCLQTFTFIVQDSYQFEGEKRWLRTLLCPKLLAHDRHLLIVAS
jgi:hypothetical protein